MKDVCNFCNKSKKEKMVVSGITGMVICQDCINTIHDAIQKIETEGAVANENPASTELKEILLKMLKDNDVDIDSLQGDVKVMDANGDVFATLDNIEEASFDVAGPNGPTSTLHDTPTPSQIKAHLDKYVIGQDATKKTLAVAVYNHYKRLDYNDYELDVEIQKSNILMLGPTGSGKTYIAQSLAKYLNVPFAIADATSLTQAGYVGDDVESMLTSLYQNADGDIAACERGIIYIDEIDKIAKAGANESITRDVSGEGVQQALLKVIEGTKIAVPISAGRKHPNGQNVIINTKNILFICGGAFAGLEHIVKVSNKQIGFDRTAKKVMQQTTAKDLTTYGMMPELMGRLPIICNLSALDETALCEILTKPKNSIVKQYQALLQMDGVELTFTDGALVQIAKLAIEQKIGARGLRSILEATMNDIMFNLPDQKDIKTLEIKADDIINNWQQPLLEQA